MPVSRIEDTTPDFQPQKLVGVLVKPVDTRTKTFSADEKLDYIIKPGISII